MNLSSMSLMSHTDSLSVPIAPKKVAIGIVCENTNIREIISTIKNMGINTIFVPNGTRAVRSYLDSDYRNFLYDNGLKPIKGDLEDASLIHNKNFVIDMTNYLDAAEKRFNISKFGNRKSINVISEFVSKLQKITDNTKILLYVIDLDKEFEANISYRRFGPIFLTLSRNRIDTNSIPFDKLICYSFSKSRNINDFVLLFDKTKELDYSKIRQFMYSLSHSPILKHNKTKQKNNDSEDTQSLKDYKTERFEKMEKRNKSWEINQEGVGAFVRPVANAVGAFAKRPAVKMAGKIAGSGLVLNTGLNMAMGDPAANATADTAARLKAAQTQQDDLDKSVVPTHPDGTMRVIGTGLAGAAVATGITMGGLALANWVTNKLEQRAWQNKGCEKVADKLRKQQCLAFIKNKTTVDLQRALSQCQTPQCKQMIQTKLQQLV